MGGSVGIRVRLLALALLEKTGQCGQPGHGRDAVCLRLYVLLLLAASSFAFSLALSSLSNRRRSSQRPP